MAISALGNVSWGTHLVDTGGLAVGWQLSWSLSGVWVPFQMGLHITAWASLYHIPGEQFFSLPNSPHSRPSFFCHSPAPPTLATQSIQLSQSSYSLGFYEHILPILRPNLAYFDLSFPLWLTSFLTKSVQILGVYLGWCPVSAFTCWILV